MIRIGFMFDRGRPPTALASYAALLDSLGADDLWVVEDLGWAGSIASAAFALAASSRLRVGIGIAPVALRNPALLAMELAALERVHPGRLVAGVGHGVPEWMRKVGASTPRKLALLEETIVGVRGLLAGSTVNLHGQEVTVDGLSLVHPPASVPPLVTGVVQPRSLELSGRVADGTIIAEGHGPAQIVSARAHIDRGIAAGSRPAHELIVFAFLRVGPDLEPAREAIEGQASWLGVPPSSVYVVSGPASSLRSQIADLEEAGASTVVLRPLGPDPDGQTREAMAALRG
jgi:5,10-methylenetetrahydromethanopterin reductase